MIVREHESEMAELNDFAHSEESSPRLHQRQLGTMGCLRLCGDGAEEIPADLCMICTFERVIRSATNC